MSLLEIKNLSVTFNTPKGKLYAVRSLSLEINEGETHALVGESGCGKSVSSLAIMGLLPSTASINSGSIEFVGEDLLSISKESYRKIRGNQISMIFQDPMTSLNPVYTCGNQVMESILLHQDGVSKDKARKRCLELFELVKIPDAESRIDSYPHELSGGMRQRVMIAMALSSEPKLLIADEPTTALDVTVQAQILQLLKDIQRERGMAILFITHDLGVVAEVADRVTVLYAGHLCEFATVESLFKTPHHPYSVGLLDAVTSLESGSKRLSTIEGRVLDGTVDTSGCPFSNRCKNVVKECVGFPNVSGDSVHSYYCHNPIN